MLEQPKALLHQLSDRERDIMVDQQATPTEAEIAWLGGIIEGEGTLSLAPQRTGKGSKYHKITVVVRLYNSDAGIILKALEIMEKLGVNPHITEREQKPLQLEGRDVYVSRNTMLTLSIGLLAPAQRLLRAIQPWLFGEKSKRAEIMLKFLDRRLAMIEERAARKTGPDGGGGGWKVPYDIEDWKICSEFLELTQRSTKKPFVAGVLNEYEQRATANPTLGLAS
jgi:hypothetical protein